MYPVRFIGATLFLFASTPVLADAFLAVTPSRMAEMLLPGRAEKVISALAGKCVDTRWTVASFNATELICESPLNMGQSVLGQMLLGNSYSAPPRRFFRFGVIESDRGVTRVQAAGWMQLQMAFGQVNRTDFSGPEFQNSIMQFMATAGGKYPLGTTFPNHVMMGIGVADEPLGKFIALRVTQVTENSPASTAGLVVGDVISQIAGKPFKNLGDYLDATARAAKSSTYKVTLIRESKPVDVQLASAFRPAFADAVVAESDAPALTAAPIMASMADELEKLSKLNAAGVLTDAEFAEQKKKLLSR